PFWPGRRQRKDAGGSRPEIRRHTPARPQDSEHSPDQTPQNDRKARSGEQVTQPVRPKTMSDPKVSPGDLQRAIRNIPDFPQPGIQFKDITPVLADARLFRGGV